MWVVVSLASLIVLVVLVLYVPLDMAFHLDMYGRPRLSMRLAWLFGLVSKDIKKAKKRPEEKKKVIEDKRKRIGKGIRPGTILEIVRTKGLLRQIKQLLKDVLRRLRIRDLVADFRVGLDNPADTGLLFTFIGPATFFLNSCTAHEIRVQPSFGDEAVLEGFSYGKMRLRPIQMIPPFLKFAFSLATMRVVKTLVLTKWKRKK